MTNTLHHYLNHWSLATPELLAETFTSTVYTVRADSATAVLKLLKPVGIFDESAGAVALGCFNGQGAVRLLRQDAGAHLLEYAAGDDLLPLVRRGDDDAATVIIAGVLNQLHAAYAGPPPEGLRPLRRWFRGLFAKADADTQAGSHSIYVRAAQVAERLLAHPREECVLHGDIHHANIRRSERGWLAYDPKGLYGERTYDAANTVCNPIDLPELVADEKRLLRTVALLAEHLEIERARLLAFVYAYAALSASWSLEDGDDPALALRVAELVEPHLG
ncbi:MAG: phosphotransferase [Anaerolineaceae bacterium]|nr:phosphotransferase [Anaerolineaceae bacterium]